LPKGHHRCPYHERHGVWVPACAGTTLVVWRCRASIARCAGAISASSFRFTCQTATAMHSRAAARGELLVSSPLTNEGRRSAERRALGIVPRRIRLTERTAVAETPSGAPSAAIFKDRGPCFRAGHRFPKMLSSVSVDLRRISPPASQPRPANLWQPLVVAADGSARPPGRHGCETISRRRRIPFRVTTPHDAPLVNETQGIYSYNRRVSIAMMHASACAMLSIIGPANSSVVPAQAGTHNPCGHE